MKKKSISADEMKKRVVGISDFMSKILDTASNEKIYEGLSPVAIHTGDVIPAGEKGNNESFPVIVFTHKIADGFYWWYATEEKSESEGTVDKAYMEEISS